MHHARFLPAFAAAALLVAGGCGMLGSDRGGTAVSTSPAQAVVGPGGQLQPGTTMWVSLDQSLDGDEARVGQQFTARVTQDVVSPNGELLIPRGSVVSGHVTDVRSGKDDEPDAVGLAFDSLEMGGVTQPMAASIVQTDVPKRGRGLSDVRGRDVLVGAAVGAVLGGLVKGREGLLIGGALGAGAGTLISLGRDKESNTLPRGTGLQARLEQPVRSLAAIRGRAVY